MRRKDREMPAAFARMVADKCEWAVISMIDPQGMPYCVPMTIVREGDTIYFHTAKQGWKIDSLMQNPDVCIACVGDTHRLADKFTTEFESAVIRGRAAEVSEKEEKIRALRLLCERHTPANMHEFERAVEKRLSRTGVWKVEIGEMTGKRKKYDQAGEELKFGRMETL